MTTVTENKKFRFPIWGWFYVFFAVLFIADGIMVTIAVKTWNGLSTEDAYERGIKYNSTLEENKLQKEHGWEHDIHVKQNGELIDLTIHIHSKKLGQMDSSAKVSAKFFRTTQSGYDKTFLLKPTEIAGQFTAKNIKLPLQGLWDIKINSIHNNNRYKAIKRIDIRW